MGRKPRLLPQVEQPFSGALGIDQGLQQHLGQGFDRGIPRQGFQFELDAQVAVDPGRQLHRHQRIQADVEERITRVEAGGIVEPHHGGQTLLQHGHHQHGALLRIGLSQLAAQHIPFGAVVGGRLNQGPQHGRLAATELARQARPIVVQHGHAITAAPLQQQPERLEGLIRRKQSHTEGCEAALQPGRHARPRPGAPLHREQRAQRRLTC